MLLIAAALQWATRAHAQVPRSPFVSLAQAYRDRDADAAARVYSPGAVVTYRYDGTPEAQFVGSTAVRESFSTLFRSISPNLSLDLDFRLEREGLHAASGVYRLRIGRHSESFGRFTVTFDGDGRFATDISSSATLEDFERANGPLLVHSDTPALDRAFYTRLAGRYRLPDGCQLVVTRSTVRLFVRNTCTQEWRGLNRINGLEWTSGKTIISNIADRRYQFANPVNGASSTLTVSGPIGTQVADRSAPYSTRDVTFTARDGTLLSGTIYHPKIPSTQSAVVMVHGSGSQDRDGYASIIAVMADQIAANGRTVLAFDKRGSGRSGGDGARATFDVLANDAIAASEFLAAEMGTDSGSIGLAGSSQAGWIVAKAIQRGARPRDVFLLGAAGTAMTVAQQNIYNTRIRMLCGGSQASDVDLAINQQRAFFAAIGDPTPSNRERLDRVTRDARLVPAISDWLFPDSAGLTADDGQWFTVLDPAFDPLPVWKRYVGVKQFVFSQFDDSTDTHSVIDSLGGTGSQSVVLNGAQHLGLLTDGRCSGAIDGLVAFAPQLFEELRRFSR